jgi:nucleoid-associated protein YgaU
MPLAAQAPATANGTSALQPERLPSQSAAVPRPSMLAPSTTETAPQVPGAWPTSEREDVKTSVSPAPTVAAETPLPTSDAAATAVIKTVQRGDSVARLTAEVYGVATPETLEWVKQHNTHLRDLNHIVVGDTITFPPLPSPSEAR